MITRTNPLTISASAPRSPAASPRLGRVARVLASRTILFAAFQAALAAAFALRGVPSPWAASVAWWPLTVTAANLVGVAWLSGLMRGEGRRWRDFLHVERGSVRGDVLVTLGLLAVGGIVAMGPNLGLATVLWGDPQAPLATLVQPLPLWAALVAAIGFPLTIAASELPTYYGYVRPRLEALGARPWQAVVLAATVHGLQHVTLPLVPDARFMAWRALMFLPFALFVGAALRWRPRLLPYLMVAHGLIDASVALMVVQASLG